MKRDDFEEKVEEMKEDEKDLKKRKRESRTPTVKKVRAELKKMIFFYEKTKEESIMSVYPLLGPVGEHKEEKDEEEEE